MKEAIRAEITRYVGCYREQRGEVGCCGRLGSFVTSAAVEPDARPAGEACLYRYERSCAQCVRRCVNDALFTDRFDRHRCYQMCLRNEERFRPLGQADVCGKCMVGVPCAHTDPVRTLRA